MIIYKYRITVGGYADHEVPRDSEVLAAGWQDGWLVVWVLHHTLPSDDNKNTRLRFSDVMTGHQFDQVGAQHVATLQDRLGIVHHVFYERLAPRGERR